MSRTPRRSGRQIGDRFVPRRPLRLGRDAPAKMAARSISAAEVHAILTDNVIVQVIDHRARFVLLGVVAGRPLIAVVADDEISDATVLISVYEPDQDHGWTPEAIRAILEGDRREEGP